MKQVSDTHLLLIPSYNTGSIVSKVVKEALEFWHPVWVVIDGSDDGSDENLLKLAETEPHLTVIQHPVNVGKGSAVYTGILEALKQEFTHVLTMDADGQHPASFIEPFMQASMIEPQAMILGNPVFDDSAPFIRINGRKISNLLANLETLGSGIGDVLFGFRVYPIEPMKAVMESTSFGRGFDFDPEVVIRLAWRGVQIINKSVPVRYLSEEEGGISHFKYLRDNTLLIWMHVRLLFGCLIRLPVFLAADTKLKR